MSRPGAGLARRVPVPRTGCGVPAIMSVTGAEVPGTSTNLFAWWRGDDLASGVNATWVDRWGGDVLNQSTAGARPTLANPVEIGGLPAARFDGVNDFFASTSPASKWKFLHDGTGCHVFIVCVSQETKPSADGGRNPLLTTSANYSDTGAIVAEVPNTSRYQVQALSGGSSVVVATIDSALLNNTGRWLEYMYVEGRASYEYRTDVSGGFTAVTGNSGIAPSLANPGSTLYVGSRSIGGVYWQGDIAEIIIYSAEKSGAELTAVTSYLNTRYGLST